MINMVGTCIQPFKLIPLAFLLFSSIPAYSQAYVPPIGIPVPEFGIEETVDSVYGYNYYYTHYIDNTHAGATDQDNPNGTPDKPRMTIPSTLGAGSVVEIHGGPYNSVGGTYTMNGTAEDPVFIRGASDTNRPVISKSVVRFDGQYFIVENLDFYDKSTIKFNTSSKYGTLRNCKVHNPVGAIGASNPTVSATGEHIVLYRNEIHDNVKAANLDCHGIQASNHGNKIWVVDNHIYNNGGDGIQACHNCNPGPRYLYIGRNEFHGDKENGIDLKYAVDVIISQNKLHGYMHSAETGIVSPIVIGSDGAPTRVWVLFNEIYNCRKGIRIEEIDDLWIIGNLIYDISESGIIPEKKGTKTHILGNTLYNMENGISVPWRDDLSLFIFNNIFNEISGESIKIGNAIVEKSEISNNLFWKASSHGDNFVNQDPLFADTANRDFSLQATSPAIDSGTAIGGVIHEYNSLYNEDISVAFDGAIRPQGSEWDIGAYEFPTGTFPVQFNLTVNLPGPGGSVSPSGGLFTEGSQVKLTAKPEEGYAFDGWTGDLTDSINPVHVTMDSDKSITASFEAVVQYTLTTTTSGSGTVILQPSGGSYFVGTEVALTASPNPGNQFVNWSGDVTGDQSPMQTVVSGNKNVTANFSIQSRPFIEYPILAVSASTFENPNVPANTLDNNLGTRWSAEGDQWISYELEEVDTISYVAFSVHHGDQVRLSFEIEVSPDQETWTQVYGGIASGTTLQPEIYDFKDIPGRYVRIYAHGNTANNWNSLTTVAIYGLGDEATGLEEIDRTFPRHFLLHSSPNPMQTSTAIQVYNPLPEAQVNLSIFNIQGQEIMKMYNGIQKSGMHTYVWDAVDNAGRKVSPGIYLLNLLIEQEMMTIKIQVLE
jgi:uncharacterized repeat protein (TIGR02543 family)